MIDSPEKLASTIGVGLPFRLTLPWSSGTIDSGARAHVCGSYSLEAVVPDVVPTATGSPAWINPWRRKRWDDDQRRRLAALLADDEEIAELFSLS